ncbi:MAG: Ig-like domain-containing protein [Gemmatimonadaceae bacterium]|nr:Ig-like domain-containing protein [Gemmatimonadaceae bacterium]
MFASRRRFAGHRRVALSAIVLASLAACGGGGSDGNGTTQPTANPAVLNILSGQSQTGRVGSALTQPLVVEVLDDNRRPLRNVNVDFRASAGSGSTSPARGVTGSDGRATTTWTLGTVAGQQSISASVLGVTAMTFQATATAGAATQLVISPGVANVPVGDSLRLTGATRDEFGNAIGGSALTWTSDAPAIATVSAQGTVRAVAIGTATVRATSGSLSGTVAVTVVAAGASVCGTVTPVALRVGQVALVAGSASGRAGARCQHTVARTAGDGRWRVATRCRLRAQPARARTPRAWPPARCAASLLARE